MYNKQNTREIKMKPCIKDSYLLWNHQEKGYLTQDAESVTENPELAGLFSKAEADGFSSMRNFQGGIAFIQHPAPSILSDKGKIVTNWNLLIQNDVFLRCTFENQKNDIFILKQSKLADGTTLANEIPEDANGVKATVSEIATWAWKWRDYENNSSSQWRIASDPINAQQQAIDSGRRHNLNGNNPSLSAAARNNLILKNEIDMPNLKLESPCP
jgi:hypothetical protein